MKQRSPMYIFYEVQIDVPLVSPGSIFKTVFRTAVLRNYFSQRFFRKLSVLNQY